MQLLHLRKYYILFYLSVILPILGQTLGLIAWSVDSFQASELVVQLVLLNRPPPATPPQNISDKIYPLLVRCRTPPREVTIEGCPFLSPFYTHNIYRPSPIRTVLYSATTSFVTVVSEQHYKCSVSLNFKHVKTTFISRVL